MKYKITDFPPEKGKKYTFIVPVSENGELTPAGIKLDKQNQGYIKSILKKSGFQAKMGKVLPLLDTTEKQTESILLVGCGKNFTVSVRDYQKLLTMSLKTLTHASAHTIISLLTELTVKEHDLPWQVKFAVETSANALYTFDEFKSEKTPPSPHKEIAFFIPKKTAWQSCDVALKQGIAVTQGVELTKNLANLPSNICTPHYLANEAKKLVKAHKKMRIHILDESDMKKKGMGAILAVTKGSHENAKLVCLEYKNTSKKQAPIALVGKGVTFDTGGISLKGSEAMIGMKYDMCGAATVLGVFKTASLLQLPIHLIGVLAIVENMPGGGATKPEDIVVSLSGQTIEILNTDAEGRLILCDALTYCEQYKPDVVIDIATLTGAVVVALGIHATGLLSNNDDLARELLAAGQQSHDRAWQLPLWDEYQDQLKSPFADMANIGGKGAGTITAACFLSRFTKKFHWAHLDVAGTAAMMGGVDRYATGRPVPLLVQYLINRCHGKNKTHAAH